MPDAEWEKTLSDTGKGIEDIGRMLRGKGRKKPRVWSLQELRDLRAALSNHRDIIKLYMDELRDEAKK